MSTEAGQDVTRATLPPELLETVSEAVYDWTDENGMGGGRPFWDDATKLVLEVLAEHAQIIPRSAQPTLGPDAARMLGKVIAGNARAMEAARIEMKQGSAEKAMQWILNSLPDVWDGPEGTAWDGRETAQEWFDRTGSAYQAETA